MSQTITKRANEAAAKIAEFDNKHNGSWYCSHEQKNIARIIRETFSQDTHLTLTQLNQLQTYVDARDEPDRGGWYYGNREQFEKRHETIKAWLAQEIQRTNTPEGGTTLEGGGASSLQHSL